MQGDNAKELPPLPVPDRVMWQYGQQIQHYTAEQMRAYAEAAVKNYQEKTNG
jgi:hypothetical protein